MSSFLIDFKMVKPNLPELVCNTGNTIFNRVIAALHNLMRLRFNEYLLISTDSKHC